TEVGPVALGDLPSSQRAAAQVLISGQRIAETSFDDQTTVADVRQWLQMDRLFQAALNCNFRHQVRHLNCRLLALGKTASEIISETIQGGQVKIAIRFLRGLALM